jgi:hypothetical protein
VESCTRINQSRASIVCQIGCCRGSMRKAAKEEGETFSVCGQTQESLITWFRLHLSFLPGSCQ